MKSIPLIVGALFVIGSLAPISAQTKHTTRKHKNVISQLSHARHTNHTVRQVTVSPHRSVGYHTNQLSKNVNHETNRESKDFNHAMNHLSKSVNHAFQNHPKK